MESRPQDTGTPGRAMTLRLSPEMTEELELVARIRGIPMTHVVRIAVARHLASLAEDDAFQSRLQRRLEEERSTLERFARRQPSPTRSL
jgi:predicted DNA-binding protein